MPALALATALALVVSAAAPAEPAGPPALGFDTLFGEDPHGRIPTEAVWDAAGTRVAYLWSEEGGEDALWLQELGGRRTPRLLPGDLDPSGPAIDGIHWTPAADALLLEAGGDLYLAPLPEGEILRLTATPGAEEDPKLSPGGATVAFVREGDLYLLDLATGRERALTTDGVEGEILNGVASWVYWEEIWDRDATGFWWSPAGDRIAYARFDETAVRRYPLVDSAPPYPELAWQRYPVAGEANPRVRIGVMAVAGGETVWLSTGDEPDLYLARVDWWPDGRALAVQRLNREQDRLDLLRCDPEGSACETIHTETSPTWVNLSRDLVLLADGRFLWTSEREGWRAVYLHAADGAPIARVSPPDLAVTSLDAVLEASGEAIYTAFSTHEMGALHRVIFRQALDGAPPAPLTAARQWSAADVTPAGGRFLHTWSDASTPRSAALRDAAGRLLSELPSAPPAGYDPESLPQWRFVSLPGPEGSRLPAALLAPPDRPPGRLAPAIMYHYGGPASQVVADRWTPRVRDLWHRMMAQRGYAVLAVDNQGSTFFGKRGEDRIHRRFGPLNLAAQLAGVEYLKGLGWVDPERVGLWGWSGGGSNTLYSVLNAPGTWRAAVAGAPVTDWHLYDSIWTERYLDHPRDNPDGYRDSSAITYAARLSDPLLLVHGTADDNVHPQNTERLARALVAAGRPFELALHPGQKHGLKGADERHFYERMTEFFDRHLGGGPERE